MTYESMGEFHDLFMAPAWDRLDPAVADVFAPLGTDDVLVDLGAGTGLGTLAVTAASAAQVWAVEPSPTMRAVLLHRVAASGDLASRVSVLAGAAPDVLGDVPTPVAGVLATHVIGHLDATGRTSLFAWLAAHLSPDGTAVFTHQPAALADDASDEMVEETRLGAHVYRATYRGTDEQFVTRYDVLDADGVVLRSLEASGAWQVVTYDDLSALAQTHGLHCRPAAIDGVCLVTR